MRSFVRCGAMALSAIAVFASPARPQASGGCDPIGNVSGVVGRAQFSISRATAAINNNASAIRDLQDVVRTLGDDKTDNPLARNYILGEAYILLLTQPGISFESPRSAVGLTTNPTAKINLFSAADSAFSVVEKLAPACVGTVNEWRQHSPWRNTLTAAFSAIAADSYDSVEMFAKRALLIDRRSPYAYYLLGVVARQRKDISTASQYWSQALAAAGTDTSFTDIRMRTLYEIAATASDRAAVATGADKKTLAHEAITAWQNYMNSTNEDPRIAESLDRLSKLYVIAGDSAAIPTIYAQLLANPSKYGEYSLISAGVIGINAKRPTDAAKFFESALALNASSRDAMRNLILSYIAAREYHKIVPVATRLIMLEPSNPDYMLFDALAYQGMAAGTKDKAQRKLYSDSLTYYNSKLENALVRIAIVEFVRGESQTTLGGTIENLSSVPKSYTISVEFLDKAGNVIASQDAPVGPVVAKSTQRFRVTIPKGGVYGFRYKPLG